MTQQHSLSLSTEEQFQLLVSSVRDYAIFVLDPRGHVATWNPGAESIKGYTADEIIGKHFSVFYPADDVLADRPGQLLAQAAVEGRVEYEGWRLRKDGSRFWADVVITALRGADGQLVGFAKITRDITARRLTDEALHRSEQRFRLLVDAVRDYALIMLSPDGIVVSWNTGAQRNTGYSAEEIIGRHFALFYPPDDAVGDKPQMELEIALSEGRYEEEGWRVRKDGTRFWANAILAPVRDQEGKLLGFAKVTRDLTDRKRAHDELVESQQRSRELADQNIAKDEFLGLLSHELRTPLSVLYGGTKLLRQHDKVLSDEDRADLIDNLATEADRLKNLIDSLLVLVTPSPSLELAKVSLNEQIAAGVAEFERTVPARKVVVRFKCDDCRVAIEPALFQRVVLNLLSNADKYSPRARPVEILVNKDGDRQVAIEVQDRGPGVDPSELSLIFDNFYRSPNALNVAPGKGLGLAICRRLITLMGGDIEARQRSGGGLIVRFCLPVASDEE